MSDLPAPLVPPEVDLRDFTYLPLDVVRLRDSDLAALSTGEGFRAAVLLWCASWHQSPAASLPDDDRLLARYAGFGRDLDAWKAVRDEALRGFVRCTDGRLYHPLLAEKAIEAWTSKQARRRGPPRRPPRGARAHRHLGPMVTAGRMDRTTKAMRAPNVTIIVTIDVTMARATNVTFTKGRERKGKGIEIPRFARNARAPARASRGRSIAGGPFAPTRSARTTPARPSTG